jgi:hypothetical protein
LNNFELSATIMTNSSPDRRHYHRICHQLNIYGMKSVDVFANVKTLQELRDNFCLSTMCSDNDVEKFCWYCLICYAHMNLNYTIFVDFVSLCKKYWTSNPGCDSGSENLDKHEPRNILHCHVERRDQSFAVAERAER